MHVVDEKALAEAQAHFFAALGNIMQAFGGGGGTETAGPALLTAQEAAEYLGMGRTKFYETHAPKLKTCDVGAGPRYHRKDLDRIISLARRNP